jgi:3-hydroxybutyryl-CoA dehydrogenase
MKIQKIGIIGAGQMGGGISHTCLLAGYHVTLYDIDQKRLEGAKDSIANSMDRQISRGKVTESEKEEGLSRLKTTSQLSGLGDGDFVVEATPENLELKLRLLKEVGSYLSTKAILTSNTSSLSITRLAAASPNPERFMGMHFMNPVPIMPLVEIIRGLNTSDDTVELVKGVISRLGKTAAVALDSPGFIVNRILIPMINEAIYTLYEGVGTVESIDSCMTLGTNQPMGPLTLADLIGLDTCLSIMRVLHNELGDGKYRPCPLLVKYVDAGWLGRKTKRGFYTYGD